MVNNDRSGSAISRFTAEKEAEYWIDKAEENIDEWGVQDIDTLLLAMQEEMGELTQAYLEYSAEDGDGERIPKELADLGALCFQLSWRLEQE